MIEKRNLLKRRKERAVTIETSALNISEFTCVHEIQVPCGPEHKSTISSGFVNVLFWMLGRPVEKALFRLYFRGIVWESELYSQPSKDSWELIASSRREGGVSGWEITKRTH